MSRLMPRPTFANVCAVGALVLAGGGLATAAIPGRSGTITACLKPATGTLRMLDTARRGSAGRCRHGERPLTWNQQSRPGADGRPGRDGVNGAKGINGVNGAANVVYRRTDTNFVAVGGGSQGIDLTADKGTATGYVFAGRNTSSGMAALVGYVICAKP